MGKNHTNGMVRSPGPLSHVNNIWTAFFNYRLGLFAEITSSKKVKTYFCNYNFHTLSSGLESYSTKKIIFSQLHLKFFKLKR